MKLPHPKKITIPKEKLVNYILSETHPTGKFKARIFRKLGFDETNINIFKKELQLIVKSQETTEVLVSPYGTKYIIDGQIKTPNGKTIKIRTIWIIEMGQDRPRFITLYPV